MPFFVRNIEKLGVGIIIHGVALDDPTVLHFGTLDLELKLDQERPIYFRKISASVTEFNFFPLDGAEPTSEMLFTDCRNDLELMLKKLYTK